GTGVSMVWMRRTSAVPYSSWTTARIGSPAADGRSAPSTAASARSPRRPVPEEFIVSAGLLRSALRTGHPVLHTHRGAAAAVAAVRARGAVLRVAGAGRRGALVAQRKGGGRRGRDADRRQTRDRENASCNRDPSHDSPPGLWKCREPEHRTPVATV